MRIRLLIAFVLLMTLVADVEAAGRRRALLIGINDYSASRLGTRSRTAPAPGRDWPDLAGTVNDVGILRDMLQLLYGFEPADIVTLTDQQATRGAILQAVERQLVQPAARGDIVLFYFAGHGSQVHNTLSDEQDQLDESIVPADSRLGARDIRDKELRTLFNRVLDRGARLTVILDNCHSGSGARGLPTGARPRGVAPDRRDVADGTYAPRPESRGALVLSATQDFDPAWETRDAEGKFHGAFSWAWIRALRDASPGEPATDTFLRAAARLRAESPFQEPVRAGDGSVPFLGTRVDRRGDAIVVAVEKIRADGTAVLHGGWANGLDVGTELHPLDDEHATTRVVITAIRGVAESEARVEASDRTPRPIRAGELLQVVGWSAPPARPLRVWMPHVAGSVSTIAATARLMSAEAAQRGIRWVTDPVDVTPTYVLRRSSRSWELVAASGRAEAVGDDAAAIAAVAKLPAGSSLFVQFGAPASIVDAMGVGADTDRQTIQPVDGAENADYILVGRFAMRRLSYAWVRPSVKTTDRRKTGLPLRTAWTGDDDPTAELRETVLRLRRIQAWHLLESPPQARSPYHLALRRDRDGEVIKDTAVIGDEKYELVLRAQPMPARVPKRYFYVFVIDSHGKSTLLFPPRDTGSVENRFPHTLPAPPEIRLRDAGAFVGSPPYGIDTYFLLSSDEPLPNPAVLEWEGVRDAAPQASTPLEQLLLLTNSVSRSVRTLTPLNWSIERVVYESIAPRGRPKNARDVSLSSRWRSTKSSGTYRRPTRTRSRLDTVRAASSRIPASTVARVAETRSPSRKATASRPPTITNTHAATARWSGRCSCTHSGGSEVGAEERRRPAGAPGAAARRRQDSRRDGGAPPL